MHKFIIGMVITLCVSMKSIFAMDITFLPQANDNLTAIESSKNDVRRQTDQAKTFTQSQGVSFRDNVVKLQKRFASLNVEPLENRARYSQDHVSPASTMSMMTTLRTWGSISCKRTSRSLDAIRTVQGVRRRIRKVGNEEKTRRQPEEKRSCQDHVGMVKIGRTAFGLPFSTAMRRSGSTPSTGTCFISMSIIGIPSIWFLMNIRAK